MSDDNTPDPATPTPAAARAAIGRPVYMQQASDADLARQAERNGNTRQLEAHDRARAAAGRIVLRCVAPFTVVDDENPDGIAIQRGQLFEVSEFDLHRFLGRGLPPAGDVGDAPIAYRLP